jgi:hypothetical protein
LATLGVVARPVRNLLKWAADPQIRWRARNRRPARASHTAVWTGTDLLIWGGQSALNNQPIWPVDAARYADSQQWTSLATDTAPTPRSFHTAIWTGHEMLIWGGFAGGEPLGDGGRLMLAGSDPIAPADGSP